MLFVLSSLSDDADILRKQLSVEEKVSRLLALESEMKNAAICDYTVNVDSYDQAAKEIIAGLFKKSSRIKKA